MRIVQLTAENVKKLQAVDITPKTDLIQVTGPNGSGKTSLLDSIFWALGGGEGIQSMPVRRGAEKALIKLNLGEIVVERRFSAKGGTTLVVKNSAGLSYPSPQAMLDDLVGSLTFDPLAFMRKTPKEQYAELRAIVKLDVDLDALDAASKADYEIRTDANRRAKELTARAGGYTFTRQERERIDVVEIIRQLKAATAHNADIDLSLGRRLDAAEQMKVKRSALDSLVTEQPIKVARIEAAIALAIQQLEEDKRRRISEVEAAVAAAQFAVDELEEKWRDVKPLPAKIDVAALQSQLTEAEVINREVERRAEQAKLLQNAVVAQAEAAALTKAIEQREEQKRAALQAAKMPVEGLALAPGSITYLELPLDQASDAEQLRVSVAIGMAANPGVRIMRIRDGSLLDENGVRVIGEMATANDFQVWMEVVNTTGEVGIVMSEGSVVKDNYAEAAE